MRGDRERGKSQAARETSGAKTVAGIGCAPAAYAAAREQEKEEPWKPTRAPFSPSFSLFLPLFLPSNEGRRALVSLSPSSCCVCCSSQPFTMSLPSLLFSLEPLSSPLSLCHSLSLHPWFTSDPFDASTHPRAVVSRSCTAAAAAAAEPSDAEGVH